MKHKYISKFSLALFGALLIASCDSKVDKSDGDDLATADQFKLHDGPKDSKTFKENSKEEKDGEHRKGIELIAEYISNIMKPIDAEESTYEEGYLIREFEKAEQRRFSQKSSTKAPVATWAERGPANVPGRTRKVVVSPINPDKWYAGTVGGGLWVTEDAGETWSNRTDYKVPNLATSTVAISANAPETIYLGTGEPFRNLDAIGGIGVLKSVDDGASWEYLENTSEFGGVGRLAINPNDENNLVVASSTGVYVTVDGGMSWEKTFGVENFEPEDEVGATNVQDLNAEPGNFDVLYAGVNSLGVIKSTDAGNTWEVVLDRDDYNPNHQRFELDISSVNTQKVVVGVYSASAATTAINTDFYVTDDAGETFELLGYEGEASEANLISGQGWYDNIVTTHPYDENIFYVGGIVVYKVTIDESLNFEFTPIAAGYNNELNDYVHVDQHGIEWIKDEESEENFKLVLSNDGGVYSTDYLADPATTEGDWSTLAIGFNSTQYYGADKRNGSSSYLAGAQDNGSHITLDANANATSNYTRVLGGDGFEVIWNYNDTDRYIVGSQYNNFARFGPEGGFYARHGESGSATSPFYSKISNANNNPDVVFSPSVSGVWRSVDFAQSWELTPIPNNFSVGANSSLDVNISVANPDIVWAGNAMTETGSYVLHVSRDNGSSFEPTSPYTDPRTDRSHNYYIAGLETSPTNPERAYALFSGQGTAKVLKTEDLGETWEDISGFAQGEDRGFPDVSIHCLVEMPYDEDVLWVGTDLGVFQTDNGGESWSFVEGLPAVSVWEFKIVNDQVVVATHGRGVWSATLEELSGYEPPEYFGPPAVVDLYQESIENTNAVVVFNVDKPFIEDVNIYVDDVLYDSVQNEFSAGTTNSYTLEDLPEGVHTIGVQITNGDQQSIQAKQEVAIVDYDEPSEFVSINVFEPEDVFTFDGEFVIDDVAGTVGQNVLNNVDHPYDNDEQYRVILKKPITITEASATFNYEDVAIVEPGDEGGIYDYVIVEATRDLRNWQALDIYDAERYEEWLQTYSSVLQGETPEIDDSLFRSQTLDLLAEDEEGVSYFEEGDEVVLRFRLVTDPGVTSFGWAIQSINKQTLSTDQPLLASEFSMYPTVSNGDVTLASKMDLGKSVVSVFNTNGVEVFSENYDLSYKTQKLALNNLSSGMYLVRISAGERNIVKKLVIN